MLERYFRLADIQGDADKLLIRGLTSIKRGFRLRPSGGISYTRVHELVLEKVQEINLDPKLFSLHTLRVGLGDIPVLRYYRDEYIHNNIVRAY